MIFAFLSTRLGKLALGVFVVFLAMLALALWLSSERREAVEADRAKARSEVLERQIEAERAASATTAAIQSEVRQSNAAASDAARNSVDPLKDGFDALRQSRPRGSVAQKQKD